MAAGSRKFSLSLTVDIQRQLGELAARHGLSAASFVRQMICHALELDAREAPARMVDKKRLTAADVVELDVTLKAMGVDLAKAVRE